MMKNEELLSLLLPGEILEYFDVTRVENGEEEVHMYIEEKNVVPENNHGRTIESHGFFPERLVEDLPIRMKKTVLHMKRRRWRDKETGNDIVREIPLVAEGTSYTREMALFLKEID